MMGMVFLKRANSYLLIAAGAWLLFKAVTLADFWALLIPALAILFLTEKYSWPAGLLAFLFLLLVEMLSAAVGIQAFNDSVIHSALILLFSTLLIALRVFLPQISWPVREGKKNEDPDSDHPQSAPGENAVDPWPASFSLLTYAEATDLDSRRLQSNMESSCHYFLELVRLSLDCLSVVLLKGDREGKVLTMYSYASGRPDELIEDLQSRPSGILTPLLQERMEMTVHPVSRQSNNIPYYPSNEGVGSLMAVTVQSEMISTNKQFILCLDRQNVEPWDAWQKDFIRMAARKLGMELDIGFQVFRAARNTDAISRICTQLQQMNQVIDLDSTYQVTIRSVCDLVECDFVALSLIQGGEHVVVKAEGIQAEGLTGRKFPVTEGLVGQAVKCKHWMPPNTDYPGPAPIFSKEEPIAGFKSLFLNPISKRGGDIMGVLTVCSRKSGVFQKAEREVLELVCRHVATKIELAQAHERIYRLALTDGLTGLKNHRTFQRGFDNMLQRARRQTISICLILCDLDHFKSINDRYGHPFGDEVLKSVAQTLEKAARRVDLVARYGGEEFALVLESSDERGGMIQAERVRKAVESLRFRVKGKEVGVTMSFGIAVFPQNGGEKQTIVDKADQALYYAKKRGRNQVVAYSAFQKKS